ncbi:MAG: hypothetical protein ACRD20_20650 [Terriglobales bacterium]
MTRILRISSSPAEPSIRNVLPSAGVSESDSDVRLGLGRDGGDVRVAALEPFLYQESRWCANCAGATLFIFVFVCEAGRVGYCVGCEEEKFVAWTRTNGEAA